MDTNRLAIEYLTLAALKPYAQNARTHSKHQLAQIADSLKEFGWTNPVLVDAGDGIVAGHGRVLAALQIGMTEAPCVRVASLTPDQVRAYVIADNQIALNAGWDRDMLQSEVALLKMAGFELDVLGFSAVTLADLIGKGGAPDLDVVPAIPARPVTQPGEVWLLGEHRVMCGDSTLPASVERLMGGEVAHLLHADPPYGMGKEADGVVNDNLYRDKLDAFQLAWWRAFRPSLASNASAYVWGNAPDLWRLWYAAGLGSSERFELRNEIVWDKKSIAGMASPDLTQFPEASERCLFFQFGQQFIGNINIADFPESWEPLRAYMAAEAEAAGIGPAEIKQVCGCGMFGHWFSRSQFTLIPQKHYATLVAAYPARFARPWASLKAEWDRVKGSARDVIHGKQDGARSYFDNAHEVMRDVWEFARVAGDDRHGHATPKPVAMMQRALVSALPLGGLCAEPFGGTGSTLIAAESVGRRCYTMELQPAYCDVIVRRWQDATGDTATRLGDNRTWADASREHERVQVAA